MNNQRFSFQLKFARKITSICETHLLCFRKSRKPIIFTYEKDLILDKTFVVDLKTDSNVICTR